MRRKHIPLLLPPYRGYGVVGHVSSTNLAPARQSAVLFSTPNNRLRPSQRRKAPIRPRRRFRPRPMQFPTRSCDFRFDWPRRAAFGSVRSSKRWPGTRGNRRAATVAEPARPEHVFEVNDRLPRGSRRALLLLPRFRGHALHHLASIRQIAAQLVLVLVRCALFTFLP